VTTMAPSICIFNQVKSGRIPICRMLWQLFQSIITSVWGC